MNASESRPRFSARFALTVGTLGLALGVGAAARTRAGPQLLTVSARTAADGIRLSVRCDGAPLDGVLAEVARVAAFRVVSEAPLRRPVSVDLVDLPLDRGIARILEGESFVLIYGSTAHGAPRLRRLVLTGGGAATRAIEPDPSLDRLLRESRDGDPRRRTAALEGLTEYADREPVRRTIEGRIADPDPRVRMVVVGLLRHFGTGWPEAEGVIADALRDPDAAVRRLALQALKDTESPQLVTALELARRDGDAIVRSMAAVFEAEIVHLRKP